MLTDPIIISSQVDGALMSVGAMCILFVDKVLYILLNLL